MFPILYSLIKPLACFKKWPFMGHYAVADFGRWLTE
jgi:hypothetical protein